MREFWIIWLNMMFLGDLEAGVSPGSSTNYIRCITFANYSEKKLDEKQESIPVGFVPSTAVTVGGLGVLRGLYLPGDVPAQGV